MNEFMKPIFEELFSHVQDFVFKEEFYSFIEFECVNPALDFKQLSFHFSSKRLYSFTIYNRHTLDIVCGVPDGLREDEDAQPIFDLFQQLAKKERLPMICQGIDPDAFSL